MEKSFNKKYNNYIKSSKWKMKREECFEIHGTLCLSCGERAVHIHHKTYINLTKENAQKDLIPLCEVCHYSIHEVSKTRKCNVFQATNIVLGLNEEQPSYKKKYNKIKKKTDKKKNKKKRKMHNITRQDKEKLSNLYRSFHQRRITEKEYDYKTFAVLKKYSKSL